MAVTAIWDIKGRVDKVINYVRNPSKVTEKAYENMAMLHSVEDVIEYAANDMKTEERKYVTALNMMLRSSAKNTTTLLLPGNMLTMAFTF